MAIEPDGLPSLLHALRRFGSEPAGIEVKSGADGFPTSVRETLVAFANTDGGTLVIGLDERPASPSSTSSISGDTGTGSST